MFISSTTTTKHAPFGYTQEESTHAKYISFVLQFACMAMRFCTMDEPPISVTFTARQRSNAIALHTALVSGVLPDGKSWNDLLHQLLSSLFFSQDRIVARNATTCPVQMYFILASMNSKGQFTDCGTIAGKFSGMLHIMRQVAVYDISLTAANDTVSENPEFT